MNLLTWKLNTAYNAKFFLSAQMYLIGSITLFSVVVRGQGFRPQERKNPVIADMAADPSISRFGNTYYCYLTTDGYDNGLKSSGPPTLWTSKDLVNWGFKGNYFPCATGQLFWAPSRAVRTKGCYYIYPTINRNIYVGIAAHPGGPYTLVDPSKISSKIAEVRPILTEHAPLGTKGIDGEVFIDDDGKAYLYWAQRGAAKLKRSMVEIDSSTTIVIQTKRTGYSEGPIMFKRRGIYYYLYTLDGHEDYKYAYGYSKVSPMGPFVFPENDIIAQSNRDLGIIGPGHGNVFCDKKERQYFFTYLEFGNGGTNRQIYIDKIDFTKDGLIKPIVLTHFGVTNKAASKLAPNLAMGKNISASSIKSEQKILPVKDPTFIRTENYAAGNAIDGNNASRWMADSLDNDIPSITLDLGLVKRIKAVSISFVRPTSGHSYTIEYSNNGNDWNTYARNEKLSFQSPNLDKKKTDARYIRLTILKGIAGVWEMKVFDQDN